MPLEVKQISRVVHKRNRQNPDPSSLPEEKLEKPRGRQKLPAKSEYIMVRVDPALKRTFGIICDKRLETISAALRRYMQNEVSRG